jgi:ATP-binding cassette, subfamily B, bacterial PglK
MLIISFLKKILSKNYFEFIFFQLLVILNAFSQIISIVSLYYFVSFLSNEQIDNSFLEIFFKNNFFVFNDNIYFYLTVFIGSILTNNLLTIYTNWFSINLINKKNFITANQIFENKILVNYQKSIQTHSTDTTNTLTTELNRVMRNILYPIMLINSKIIPLILILYVIFLKDSELFFYVVFFSFFIFYLLILIFKKRIYINGKKISTSSKNKLKIINEVANNLRIIKLFNLEKYFTGKFNIENKTIIVSQGQNMFLSSLPKNIVEIISVLVIGTIFFNYSYEINQNTQLYSTISFYVFSGYKIIPSIQTIASAYLSLKGNQSALIKVNNSLNKKILNQIKIPKNRINIFDKIEMHNVIFKYNRSSFKLSIPHFELNKSQVIGVLGESGSGKSTFIDILCGLLKPQKASFFLNDKRINFEKWGNNLKKISTIVPQKIFLEDDELRKNIAFGIPEEDIDDSIVKKSIKVSNLEKLVKSKKKKTNFFIGENGSMLSGGQIQRVGIARAVYRNFQILILDEATSALDSNNEKKILNNLQLIKSNSAIIVITHKEKLSKYFDVVYRIKDGKLLKNKSND